MKIKNKVPIPNTPRPTTPRPITLPPANAISKAFPRLTLAAFVVLTLAFVATCIPMYPANAEQSAPTIKDTAISGEDPSCVLPLIPRSIATTTIKIDNILYSAFKKAKAPSLMAFAMPCIFALPGSCFVTQADFQKVYNNASIPNTGIA